MKKNEGLKPAIKNKVYASKKKEYLNACAVMGLTLTFAMGIMGASYSVSAKDEQAVVEVWQNSGDECFYSGKSREAIEQYSTLQKEDKWPEWTIKMAEVYTSIDEIDKSNALIREAIILRDRALEADKEKYIDRDKQFINDVVYLLITNSEFDEAISFGTDYLKENEDDELVKSIFYAYMLKGDKNNAIKMLKNYIINEDSAYDLAVFAKMQIVSGDLKEGIKSLKKAWEIDNDEIAILDVLSDIVAADGNSTLIKAIKDLNKDNNDIYNLFLAAIYSENSSLAEKGLEIINSISSENIGKVNSNIIKAKLYNLMDNEEEAENAIKDIVSLEVDNYGIDYVKGWYFYNKGEYDTALEYCEKSIAENRDFSNNYGLLMTAIKKAKVEAGVEAYYSLALKKDPYNYEVAVDCQKYYQNTMNDKKAAEYDKYAERISSDEKVNIAVEDTRKNEESKDKTSKDKDKVKDNKPENTIEGYKAAIEKDDTNTDYYRKLANLYLAENMFDECIETLRAAYAKDNSVITLNNIAYYYLIVESDVNRAYANIEAAYDEMPKDLDETNKNIISYNYEAIKTTYKDYYEYDELGIPVLQLCD